MPRTAASPYLPICLDALPLIGQHARMGNAVMSVVSAALGGGLLYLAIDGRRMATMAKRRRAAGIPPMETVTRIGFGLAGILFLVTGIASLFG